MIFQILIVILISILALTIIFTGCILIVYGLPMNEIERNRAIYNIKQYVLNLFSKNMLTFRSNFYALLPARIRSLTPFKYYSFNEGVIWRGSKLHKAIEERLKYLNENKTASNPHTKKVSNEFRSIYTRDI